MALKGVKVVEFAGLAPGPFCGKILRDLGASVVRIDRIGDAIPDVLAHGKQSIAVNLKSPKGIEVIIKLCNKSDVLIEPFRRGIMEKLGLGPQVLLASNPRLVYARLTGYGQFGPLADRGGHDINYLGYSGVLSQLGRKGEKPYAPINLLADFAGGGLMCSLAILNALYERDVKTQKGKVIDCNMVEGSAYLSSWLWQSRDIPGLWEGGERGTNFLDGGYEAYDTYETKDGKYMAVGALEPKFYEEMIKGLHLNDEQITKELLERTFLSKTRDEWCQIFDKLDACVSPILDIDEVHEHAHNKERKSFKKGVRLHPTMNWLENRQDEIEDMPKIGQNSREILRNIGYEDLDINELIEDKIISETKVNAKI